MIIIMRVVWPAVWRGGHQKKFKARCAQRELIFPETLRGDCFVWVGYLACIVFESLREYRRYTGWLRTWLCMCASRTIKAHMPVSCAGSRGTASRELKLAEVKVNVEAWQCLWSSNLRKCKYRVPVAKLTSSSKEPLPDDSYCSSRRLCLWSVGG